MIFHRNPKRRLKLHGGAFFMLSVVTLSTITLNLLLTPIVSAIPSRQTTIDIEAAIAAMSLEQKVAQMFMVSLWGESLTDADIAFLTDYQPGGITLFGYNIDSPEQITTLTNTMQESILAGSGSIPAWISIDQEGGTVARLSGDAFTTIPVPMTIAATGQTSFAEAVGTILAEELLAVGINMNLAPVADVETNPDNPVIYRRAFSSDPALTAELIAAMIDGMQAAGVMAAVKHFPGHGDTSQDSHLTLPTVDVDRDRLDAVELMPFEAAIARNVGTIMAGHLWFPALDAEENRPASLSPVVLSDLLRGEMGYTGLIMTDALDMDAIDVRYDLSEAAVLAVLAGVDLITAGPHAGMQNQIDAIDAVVDAVRNGTISETMIDESVRRNLTAKARFRLLDWRPLSPADANTRINKAAHEALIETLLSQAVTLVYDDNAYVPFSQDEQVALIYPATMPSIARQCEQFHPNLNLIGVSAFPTENEIAWALGAAQNSHAAIVFAYDVRHNLPYTAMIQTMPSHKTLVVATQAPYDLIVLPSPAGYMATYTPLPGSITAACAALFGAQPITGHLPVNVGDIPAGAGVTLP